MSGEETSPTSKSLNPEAPAFTVSTPQRRSNKRPAPSTTALSAKAQKTEDPNLPKLIVVLEQACLETYKVSAGNSSRTQEDKFMLLNADDHVSPFTL